MGCRVALGDVCSFYRGASVPRTRMYDKGAYLYIHYGDLYKGFDLHIDVEDPAKPIPYILNNEKIKDSQRLRDQDIVYVLTSETVDDLGHAYLFNNPKEKPAISGTETTIVRVNRRDLVVPAYLNYLMSSPHFIRELRQYTRGMKVFRVHPKDVARIEIDLPQTEVQRQIVSILDAIYAKQKANSKLNGYLEELGKAIWRKAIETSGTSACIGDIAAEIVTGKTPSTKVPEYYGDKYPFITIPDMHSNVWLCSTERRISETGNRAQPKKLVPRGAVLVSCIATLGLVGIVQKPSHFNQQINAVVPASEGDEFFLYYAMRSITQALLGIGATGSATLNVNKSAFSQIEIPWLEGKAMAGFVQTVRPIFETIEANSIESLRLRKLSDSLLPKLMSGEIDVSKVMF